MALWGMTIDLDLCTGCQACALACKAENNIPDVGTVDVRRGRRIAWMEVLVQTDPHHPGRARFLPRPCLHCDDPPCTKVCPVFATFRDHNGTVGQVYAQCIGCRFCMAACPYNAKYFNWRTYHDPGPGQNPQVSVRGKGVVEKCTFCHHRLLLAEDRARGEGRPLAPGDYVPACVEACPTGAITFGDLADPDSAVAHQARSPRAFRLLEELGTRPKVIHLAARRERDHA